MCSGGSRTVSFLLDQKTKTCLGELVTRQAVEVLLVVEDGHLRRSLSGKQEVSQAAAESSVSRRELKGLTDRG